MARAEGQARRGAGHRRQDRPAAPTIVSHRLLHPSFAIIYLEQNDIPDRAAERQASGPGPRLGHAAPHQEDRRNAAGGEAGEGDRVPELIADPTGEGGADRGADPAGETDDAERQVEMTGAAGDVAGDEGYEDTERRGGEPIEHLDQHDEER